MTHGTRTSYQHAGCRCPACTAAETAYRAHFRLTKAKGRLLLGQSISASEAWARIRVLKQEGFTQQRITGRPRDRHLPLPALSPASKVRLRTLLRLRRLCQAYLIPDEDLPNHQRVDL